MKENIEHKIETDDFPYIPLAILMLLLGVSYLAYHRAYRLPIYFFMHEEDVENFDPLTVIHGNS